MGLSLRLILLCAIAVLPAAGLQLWSELSLRQARTAELHAEARRLALYAASELGGVVEGTRGLLGAILDTPLVLGTADRPADRGACDAYLASLERRFPDYVRLVVTDPAGQVICAGQETERGAGGGFGDLPYFRTTIETRGFVVGGFRAGGVTGRPRLPVALPLLDPTGAVRAVGIASLDADRLSARLQERGVPPGGSVTVADRDGTIVARAPESRRFVGTRIPESFLALLTADAPGAVELTSQDGTRRMLGYVPAGAGPSGLYVSAGLSTEAGLAPIERATRLGFLLVAAGLACAVLAAALAARLYLRPVVRRLLDAMGRWRQGDTTARVGPMPGAAEFERLGAGFDAMADALAARTDALRDSEEWLRLAQEAGGVGAWEFDLATGAARWSEGQYALLGLDPAAYGTPSVARFREMIHPEDRVKAAAASKAAVRTGAMEAEFRVMRRTAGGAEEVRWLVARGRARRDASGRVTHIVGVNVDVTARHAAEERQRVLMREVDHRAKNALTVVQATLRLTPKDDAVAYARAVEGRVRALARAQTLLAEGQWEGVSLREVASSELEPFLPEGGARAVLEGPEVTLAAGAVQPLAMALHELATNATKHGALSVPGGRVTLGWAVSGGALRLRWEEGGGPPIAVPSRKGFGSRVLEATIRDQLGGRIERRWEPSGLVCEMEVPAARAVAGAAPEPAAAD